MVTGEDERPQADEEPALPGRVLPGVPRRHGEHAERTQRVLEHPAPPPRSPGDPPAPPARRPPRPPPAPRRPRPPLPRVRGRWTDPARAGPGSADGRGQDRQRDQKEGAHDSAQRLRRARRWKKRRSGASGDSPADDFHHVHPDVAQRAGRLLPDPPRPLAELLPDPPIGGIHPDQGPVSASSSVISPTSGISRSRGSTDADRHQIVAAGGDPKRLLPPAGRIADEVAHQEHGRPAAHRPVEQRGRRGDVGPPPFRLEIEEVAQHPEAVAAALAGREPDLGAVGEQDRPDPVPGADRREGEGRRRLRCGVPLEPAPAPKGEGAGHVQKEQHGQLALLHELLDVERTGPGGDVPVHRADVVAGVVLAHLGKFHPLPLEGAEVSAGEPLGDQLPRRDLDAPDPPEQLFGGDVRRAPGGRGDAATAPEPGETEPGESGTHGTSTASRTRRTISSPSTSSASAS